MHANLCLPGTTSSNKFFEGIESPDLSIEVAVTLVDLVVGMKQHDVTV